jgi:Glycosyl transferase family 2
VAVTDYQIGMLWMRGALSFLEQLCVQSFLDAGHHVVLYSYDPIGRVPDGVEFRDAGEILPEAGFLVHERTGSPALHSDLFRYRLLERGERMIWADTDAYCRQRFRPVDGHLYGWESEKHVNGGVLGLPPDSPTLAALLDFTRDEFAIPPWEKRRVRRELEAALEAGTPVHVGDQTWGVWGPHAVTHFLGETGEIARALPQTGLYPYSFARRRRLLTPGLDHSEAITEDTQSIHLYGRRIRKRMAERDHGLPDPESLMGQLLRKHRIDPCEAPLRDWPEPDRDADFAKVYREAATGRVQYEAAAVGERASAPRGLSDVLAITTMKNEGPFILDWVAYHLSVGITHFLVYTNDCDDPTNEILDGLAVRGLVSRVDNAVGDDERPQRVALAAAASHPRFLACEAYVVMDVDEYINIHAGEGTIADLFAAAGDPELISMTWRFFGTGGAVAFEDRPVVEQFTRAAPLLVRKPHQNWGFKTIVRRSAPYAEIGIHRPLAAPGDMPHWTNGSGAQMPERYHADGWRNGIDCWGYDLVTLNHYAVRSVESFLVKRDRGRTNHIARPQGADYWNVFNRNDEEDRSILPRWERATLLREVFARDPALGAAHEKAVAWHRARIADLKAVPREAAMFAHLSADAMSNNVVVGDLPEREPVAVTDLSERVDPGFPIREDTPAMGQEAEEQFRGLMTRIQARQRLLPPLASPPGAARVVIVTSMKNEGCFILEWIAYHLSIGVTHFVVYTNDCDDPTNAVLDRLQALGLVTRLDNPFNREAGQKPQRGALNDAATRPEVRDADWVGVIDVDEFVNIHVGDGSFAALLDAMRHPNVISMTWRFFGNRGVHAYDDAWQTETFLACAPLYIPKPRLGWGFKSFFRPDAPFSKIGVHRPLDLDEARAHEVRWVNGAGREMPERVMRKNEWFSRKDTIGYDMVTLNHYVLRSAESYLVKRQRGRINHVDQDQGLSYWTTRNYATETDRSIQSRLGRAKGVLAGLLEDAELRDLHHEAVGWHRARIDGLMRLPDYQALYRAITEPGRPDAIWRGREVSEDDADADEATGVRAAE